MSQALQQHAHDKYLDKEGAHKPQPSPSVAGVEFQTVTSSNVKG